MIKKYKISLKKIAYWTVPPGIHAFLEQIYRLYKANQDLSPELRKTFLENEKFMDIHKGQRCFILATGPSLKKQNLLPLQNEICISISNFFLHPSAKEVNPLYHAVAPHHPPFDFDILQKEMKIFKENSTEKTILFAGYVPYKYSIPNFFKQFSEYNSKSCYYINYSSSTPIDENNYNDPSIWNIAEHPFSPRSSLYIAIQLAVYMGFTKIYLLGVDHDYLSELSQIEGDQHFYSQDQSPIKHQGDYSQKEDLFSGLYYRWIQYRLMRKYLENNGIHIYNATEGGLLDVFPCVHLTDVILEKK